MLLSLCVLRENRCRESHTFLMGVNEVKFLCTMKRFDIPEVKIALV